MTREEQAKKKKVMQEIQRQEQYEKMDGIKRWISTKAYKHIKVYVLAFIVIMNIVVVVVDGIVIHLLSPENFPTIKEGIWQVFTDVLDPGFLSTYAQQQGTATTRAVEVAAIVLCMVTFTGAIIGYISNVITTIIDNSATGPKRMYLKDHILILNWNNRAAGIISEYLFTDICEDVVVLSTADAQAVTKEIEDSILELGYTKKQKHVNFVVKQGEPFSFSELDAICARQARTIIVLSDSNPADGDLRTLKTVMMVSQMNSTREDCAIVVEADNPNIYELVCRIQDNQKCTVIPAYLNKLLGKLLAHIALQPELNIVFAEILSHNGNEFYSIPFSELKDVDVSHSEEEMVSEYLEHYCNAIPIMTSRTFKNNTADRFYVFSGRHNLITNQRSVENLLPLKKLQINPSYPIPMKKIIVLGSNSKLKYMINSFLAYQDNYGNDKLEVVFIDTPDHLENIPENEGFCKRSITNRYKLQEIRKIISEFDLRTFNTIVILSDDMVSSVEYDSGALVSLIDINKAMEGIPKSERPEIIVEILNPKNHEIVRQYNINNVIVSNKYISSLMAQLGDDDSIFDLIYDMLTFDREKDDLEEAYDDTDESRELYIKRVGDYFVTIPSFESISQLVRSIYAASECKHIVLGIIRHNEDENDSSTKSGNGDNMIERTYTFDSDLDALRDIRLDADDELVIFAPEW